LSRHNLIITAGQLFASNYIKDSDYKQKTGGEFYFNYVDGSIYHMGGEKWIL